MRIVCGIYVVQLLRCFCVMAICVGSLCVTSLCDGGFPFLCPHVHTKHEKCPCRSALFFFHYDLRAILASMNIAVHRYFDTVSQMRCDRLPPCNTIPTCLWLSEGGWGSLCEFSVWGFCVRIIGEGGSVWWFCVLPLCVRSLWATCLGAFCGAFVWGI